MKFLISIALFLGLVSCAGEREQTIRHVVVAELIQREHVAEDRIEIKSIQFTSPEGANVEATILGEGSRGGEGRIVHCRLKRASQRWTIQSVEGQ